eukprot:4782338-Lingulodinium_polyedra.AAC.1
MTLQNVQKITHTKERSSDRQETPRVSPSQHVHVPCESSYAIANNTDGHCGNKAPLSMRYARGPRPYNMSMDMN